MTPYQNQSGNSGVLAYEAGPDFIVVQFQDRRTYRYTYESTGPNKVEQMKQLAHDGRGLCTFISKNVRAAYEVRC